MSGCDVQVGLHFSETADRPDSSLVALEPRARETVFPPGESPPVTSSSSDEPQQQNNLLSTAADDTETIDTNGGSDGGGKAHASSAEMPEEATRLRNVVGTWTQQQTLNACVPISESYDNTALNTEDKRIYQLTANEPVAKRPTSCFSAQPYGPKQCGGNRRGSWPNYIGDSSTLVTIESDLMNGEDTDAAYSHHHDQQQALHLLNGDCKYEDLASAAVQSLRTEETESMKTDTKQPSESSELVCANLNKVDDRISLTSNGETQRKEDRVLSVSSQDMSPNLRSRRSSRKSNRSKRSDGSSISKSGSPSPAASPVLYRLNTTESINDDDTSFNGDEGSGEDDEDDGIYSETFRYSSYKYIGNDDDDVDDEDATDGALPIDGPEPDRKSSERLQEGRVGSSYSESRLYDRLDKKNHQRSLSMTTSERKGNEDNLIGKTLSKKIIKRHISMGAETYQMPSERVYEVERTLILKKPDTVTSFGFHLLGQNPMVISTIEPGSIAEIGGVQIGDRLVTINGTNVVKATQSTIIDIIAQSPECLELGVASGVLSRDTCICSGYLNLKPDGIMRNWKRRWCQLKYDGFLYYYKTDDCINPLGAISMSNYVIIRGSDCGRSSVFKLVKYGQKTYYIQTESDEEMNWWASNINMATSMANSLREAWLDISSHNVRLPALSIRSPECHGYLTKVGYRNTNWRKRYCVLKSACLYYYKDQTSSTAKGVAHLHGYSIEEETQYQRRFGFMAVPPVAQMRTFHFTAENLTDKQRWMAALRNSIGKWVKVED